MDKIIVDKILLLFVFLFYKIYLKIIFRYVCIRRQFKNFSIPRNISFRIFFPIGKTNDRG